MQLQQFITDFAAQFDNVKPEEISADTELETLDEWSSLHALSIIAMIDSNYGQKVSGTAINQARTVGDIFKLIQS